MPPVRASLSLSQAAQPDRAEESQEETRRVMSPRVGRRCHRGMRSPSLRIMSLCHGGCHIICPVRLKVDA
jgi:hypothetical protein